MLLFIKKRSYKDRTRGNFANRRFWRIQKERLENLAYKAEILKITPEFLKGKEKIKPKAIFHGHGGRDGESNHAKSILEVGKEYFVEDADTGPFCTYIKLEGFSGVFNSVMFDVNYAELEKL